MILNKFLFDKEIAIVLLMCNANEYCQGLCQSSKIILCDYSLNSSGFLQKFDYRFKLCSSRYKQFL